MAAPRWACTGTRTRRTSPPPSSPISLGDTAVFRIGGPERGGKTETLKLASGDVLVMGGASRLCYHGIDRVLTGTSTLLKDGGRINLTLRRVTKP